MAVLIQGDKPGNVTLPVRKRQFQISFNRPFIEHIDTENTFEQAVTCHSRLILKGRQLWNNQVQVQIGHAKVTPQAVSDTEIVVDLAALAASETRLLRAGVQGIQILHPAPPSSRSTGYELGVESNVKPLVLCPTILTGDGGIRVAIEERDEDRYWGEIGVQVQGEIEPLQRVFLILNGLSDEDSRSYIFRASRRSEASQTASFLIENVVAGAYLARIQIDGAESPLWVNENDEYAGPMVVIP
jgi:hypothetical protein